MISRLSAIIAARPAPFRASLSAIVFFAVAAASAGCEDQAIGRPCDVLKDAGALEAVYNGQALECPSRICLKPSRDINVAMNVDTAPHCTAECSSDSDCEGEKRNSKNTNDKRCTQGFVCGIAFEVGPLCCKKLCLCKDFLKIPAGGLQPPTSCTSASPVRTCQNL